MTATLTSHEADWLDLVADLMTDPPPRWPYTTVTRLLTETFDAPTGTYYNRVPGGPLEHGGWPPSHFRRGDSTGLLESGQRRAQLTIPVLGPGPSGHRSFVVARAEDYTPDEVALAGRLRRLFVGLDRHITEHARLRAARDAVDALDGGPEAVADELGITARQLAVLELLAHGLTAAAIGRRLAIGERTVQKHLQRVYGKLAVGDRLSAVQLAQACGLLTAPWPPRNTHFPH